jgi:hypothetical protein
MNICQRKNKRIIKKFEIEIPLEERIEAGKKFENRKMLAPSRPHVSTPDESPTLETLIGILMSPIDKFMDLFSKFPEKYELDNIKTQKEIPMTVERTI